MSKHKFTTKSGRANYPWLQPGRPDTAFHVDGKYKFDLVMSPDDASEIMELVDKCKAESFPATDSPRLPYSIDSETGDVTLKIGSKFEPKYVDAKGNPIPEVSVPLMYSGSTLRAGGQVESYVNGANQGIALRLGAIQVIDPVGSAGHVGSFDAVDGFVAPSAKKAVGDDENYDF